ncbi:MAG: C10 family peptidase [Duncaniella sp.]|nr:C10 family peptidase [Duncaniella sp.]
MTKSTLALAATLLVSGMASARSLSPAEALSRALADEAVPASSFSGMKSARKVTPALTLKTKSGSPAIYVINNTADAGYMIVSADDMAAPLLGWTDEGSFEASEMAPGLRYWLGALQEQIEWAEYNALPDYAPAAPEYYATIAPKMTTRWDQGDPYNMLCPLDGSRRTFTGCVATAMAQVLKARNYPSNGTGTHSYNWNGQTLSFDYGNTTFDWDNMADSYNYTSTAAQKNAVANLMLACGIGVDMYYGTGSSGAVTAKVPGALVDYFGYDKSIQYCGRAYYTSQQWEKLIYDEIAQNGPIYLSGRNDEGGHAFVADGYNKGFFHINWGWGGLSNGYYRINALDPDSQGAGGSSAGYNVDQGLIRNVKPAKAGSDYGDPVVLASEPISAVVSGSYLSISGPFFNYSPRELKGRLGVQFYDFETGEKGMLARMSLTRMQPGGGFNTISVTINLMKAGHWRGELVYTEGDKSWPILVPLSQKGYIDITKTEDGAYTVSVPSNGTFTPGALEFVSPLFTNKTFQVKLNYTSTATDNYTHEVVGVLYNAETMEPVTTAGTQNTIIEPGENSFTYTSDWLTKPAAGKYKFALVAADTPLRDRISDVYDVTLEAGSSTFIANVANDGWEIVNANDVNINNVEFKVKVNVTYGYMSSPLVARIYQADGMGYPIGTIASPLVFGAKGDEIVADFSGPFLEGEPNTTYTVYIYDGRGNRLSSTPKSMTTGAQSGIDEINADDEQGAEYFNLQGMKVANPVEGQLYLMRTPSGKVKKIVK